MWCTLYFICVKMSTQLTNTSSALLQMLFASGSDGNVTIAAGTTTLTRDMYYNNLTISAVGTVGGAGAAVNSALLNL